MLTHMYPQRCSLDRSRSSILFSRSLLPFFFILRVYRAARTRHVAINIPLPYRSADSIQPRRLWCSHLFLSFSALLDARQATSRHIGRDIAEIRKFEATSVLIFLWGLFACHLIACHFAILLLLFPFCEDYLYVHHARLNFWVLVNLHLRIRLTLKR